MSGTSPDLSVVVPLHNEAGNLFSLYQEIKETLDHYGLSYEIIFVNDASTDNTPNLLRQIKQNDDCVRIIRHRANYGEAAALSSGYLFSRGDIIVTMDGDGQNDPHDIPSLVDKIKEGYRAATGWRKRRQEKYVTRILPSVVANWIISLVTGVHVHDNGCGLKAYDAQMTRGVIIPHGFHRFLPAVLGVKSKEVAEVRVSDRRRIYGQSHYGLARTREVIRELLTFRFMRHNPRPWVPRFRVLSFLAAGIAILLWVLAFTDHRMLTLIVAMGCLGLTFLLRMIYQNLRRVIAIKEETVFQREEVEA
jgi:glycosyltransferase involved in cell wall biosynthesis